MMTKITKPRDPGLIPRVAANDPLWEDPKFQAWIRGIEAENAKVTEPIEIRGGISGPAGGNLDLRGGTSQDGDRDL